MSYSLEIDKKDLQKLFTKLEACVKDDVIKKSLNTSGFLLSAWSKSNRLSGPRPTFLGVVTNRLRSSIASTKAIKSGNEYSVKIGTNVQYARAHEFGYSPRNLRARPFLRPSLQDAENRKKILNEFTKNINEALSK